MAPHVPHPARSTLTIDALPIAVLDVAIGSSQTLPYIDHENKIDPARYRGCFCILRNQTFTFSLARARR